MNPLLVLLLCALYLLVPFTSANSIAVEYCNNKADWTLTLIRFREAKSPISKLMHLQYLEDLYLEVFSDQVISGGKMKVDLSYFGFHVHSEDHDLCKETECPVSVGDFVVSNTEALPGITPPGNYNIKMTMLDGDKKQLTCITFAFYIGFVAPENLADN